VTKKYITEEDSRLFRQLVGEVRHVNNQNELLHVRDKPPKPYPMSKPSELVNELTRTLIDQPSKVGPEESISFTANGVQKSVLAKLRKGSYIAESEIDLHGLTNDLACSQLMAFLNASVTSGYRCVRIIHGKGYRSSATLPVLKNEVNNWLRQHAAVKAFCSASFRNGGAGAVDVLLKIS
jgi:DNA-nicking Smr family endonuclease